MDFMEIANDFVDHWFGSFDNTDLRPVLASLYKPEMSVVKTVVTTRDATPATAGGILITAIGSLAIDNAFDTPMGFTSTFLLQPNDQGGYFVYSQIFRLILN
ncbi:Nuclear transport factor 2Eukaryote [Penicillium lividum]|nr:Nuclear transport factor 2Eukaryote [Penicillium lividum]